MLGKYNRRTVKASSGAVAPGATVSFYWQATGVPVIAYADQDGNNPIGSSVQSDADGRIAVFVTPGLYRIVVTLDGAVIEELTHEPIVGQLAYADPDSYALRSELKLHDEDIQLMAKSVTEMKLAGGPRMASGRVLSADEIGMLADTGAMFKTAEYHDGTSVGGAEYQLRTRASYRTEIGDAAWVPDGSGDHYLLGGTTYIVVLVTGRTLSIEQFGVLDGGNATAALQAISNRAVSGTVVRAKNVDLLIDTGSVSFANITNLTLDFSGSTITEVGYLGDTLTFTSCNNLRVVGGDFTSEETYALWDVSTKSDRYYYIHVNTSTGVRISGLRTNSKRCAIRLTGCHRGNVYDIDHTGFLPDLDVTVAASPNECPSIEIRGGRQNKVWSVHGEDTGSTVLVGQDAQGPTVFGITGRNIHDNVVYISSATRARVSSVDGEKVNGQIVKLRGSQNIGFGNTGINTKSSAYSMTGNGVTPDSLGANGSGNIMALNSARNMGADGISVGSQDGLFQRDGVVALNCLENLTSTGGFAGIRASMTQGGIYFGNNVNKTTTSYAYIVTKAGANPTELPVIAFNTSSEHTGASPAFWLQDLEKARVACNSSDTTNFNMEVRNNHDSVFVGNLGIDGGRCIEFRSTSPSLRNVIIGNRGSTGAPGDTNAIMDNFPASGFSIATAPAYLGQVAVVTGVAYMAINTSSAAGWVAIS